MINKFDIDILLLIRDYLEKKSYFDFNLVSLSFYRLPSKIDYYPFIIKAFFQIPCFLILKILKNLNINYVKIHQYIYVLIRLIINLPIMDINYLKI